MRMTCTKMYTITSAGWVKLVIYKWCFVNTNFVNFFYVKVNFSSVDITDTQMFDIKPDNSDYWP